MISIKSVNRSSHDQVLLVMQIFLLLLNGEVTSHYSDAQTSVAVSIKKCARGWYGLSNCMAVKHRWTCASADWGSGWHHSKTWLIALIDPELKKKLKIKIICNVDVTHRVSLILHLGISRKCMSPEVCR